MLSWWLRRAWHPVFLLRSMFTKLAVIEEKTSKLQGGGTPRKRSPLTGDDALGSARSSSGARGMKLSLKRSDMGDADRIVLLQRTLREKDSHIAQLQVRSVKRRAPDHHAPARCHTSGNIIVLYRN